jgi:hypothetical protein
VFDLRYHVASLAAVFLMLVVGILVGIGISGRGFVSDAERTRLNADITSLREQRDAANTQVEDLENRQQAAEDFVEGAYPVLAEQRLAGKRVAILVLGPVDPSLGELEQAIEQDAGGNVARIRALTLPLRLEQVEGILDRRRELAGYAGDEQLGNLGRDLGHELATGGETPLWDALESELVEVKQGSLKDPVDGIVVMRTAEPQQGETSRFLSGIYQGLGGAGVPVVGVEPQRVEQAAIPVFQRHELSTVDGVDTELGKLGMILLLAGGDRGDYGTRDTAEDGILPPIEPLPPNGG